MVAIGYTAGTTHHPLDQAFDSSGCGCRGFLVFLLAFFGLPLAFALFLGVIRVIPLHAIFWMFSENVKCFFEKSATFYKYFFQFKMGLKS
ncbi:hypothetical protein PAE9249_00010 [Paenibacillus sp. CECT 9249]|nr:hypothetical protein PAE9249_00010 [Paenibacillus sp. CECT 9249]